MRHLIAICVLTICLAAACSDAEAPAASPAAAGRTATVEATPTATPVAAVHTATPAAAPSVTSTPRSVTLDQVGFSDLERRGANAYVRVLGDFAYVGSTSGGGCRGLGVSVV